MIKVAKKGREVSELAKVVKTISKQINMERPHRKALCLAAGQHFASDVFSLTKNVEI